MYRWLKSRDQSECLDLIGYLTDLLPLESEQLPSNPWADGRNILIEKDFLAQILPKLRSLLMSEKVIDLPLARTIYFMDALASMPSHHSFLEADDAAPIEHNPLSLVLIACKRQICSSQDLWEPRGSLNRPQAENVTHGTLVMTFKFMQ